MLKARDPGAAGFFLQQAVEKLFKAFLLSRGWKLRRIHSLSALLDDAVVHDPSLEEFRDPCQKISAFYAVERYPFVVDAPPTEDDVRTSVHQVGDLIDRLRENTL
jgi:HEPN domain-containing protein